MKRFRIAPYLTFLAIIFLATSAQNYKAPQSGEVHDPYVPTPQVVVNEMLAMADVDEDDVIYDLGCGDGRIVITALTEFGAKRGVGVDIDPQRIRESRKNAKEAGVTDRVRFIEDSYFDVDFSDATVLALYLLPDSLAKLRSDFEAQLEPGTKIVTHDFEIEGWEPIAQKTVSPEPDNVSSGTIYLWEVPAEDET